jgi:hypothetical protein
MQEGGALQTDIDERGLHPRQDTAHATLVDIADQAAARGTLDEDLLEHAIFHQCYARLTGCNVDQYLFTHSMHPICFSRTVLSDTLQNIDTKFLQ